MNPDSMHADHVHTDECHDTGCPALWDILTTEMDDALGDEEAANLALGVIEHVLDVGGGILRAIDHGV